MPAIFITRALSFDPFCSSYKTTATAPPTTLGSRGVLQSISNWLTARSLPSFSSSNWKANRLTVARDTIQRRSASRLFYLVKRGCTQGLGRYKMDVASQSQWRVHQYIGHRPRSKEQGLLSLRLSLLSVLWSWYWSIIKIHGAYFQFRYHSQYYSHFISIYAEHAERVVDTKGLSVKKMPIDR